MVALLSLDLLQSLQSRCPCRLTQLRQLAILYNDLFASPSVLVAYGLESADASKCIQAVLEERRIRHVIVKSRECLSQRHLLAKIFAACQRSMGETNLDRYDRIDSINSLAVNLEKMLDGSTERLVLVLEGIDKQRGPTATLLPALAKLGDLIRSLSIIMTSSSPRPLVLHKSGVPYIHFPPFTRSEAVSILLKSPPRLVPDPLSYGSGKIDSTNLHEIFRQFSVTVYDSLTAYTSTSLPQFRRICEKLWPRFIWPLISGEPPPGRGPDNSWNFARLLGRSRSLFQADGELALQEHLRSSNEPWTFEGLIAQRERSQTEDVASHRNEHLLTPNSQPTAVLSPNQKEVAKNKPPLLKHFSTLILIASYLASHTAAKHDIILFSRLSSSSTTKRKYLSRSRKTTVSGGITKSPSKRHAKKGYSANDNDDNEDEMADPSTPSKTSRKPAAVSAFEATGTPKKEKTERSMRAIFDKTSNIPRPFTLERLIAILRTVHPQGMPRGRGAADRVYFELGELERLRLVVRVNGEKGDSGGRTGAVAAGDQTESVLEERWRVNVGREWVVDMGKVWGMGLEGWEID